MFISLIKDMCKRYSEHEVDLMASSFTYYFLFSFFPMLIFINSLVGFFGFNMEEAVLSLAVIPDDVQKIIVDSIHRISNMQSATLMITSLGVSIWSAATASRVLFRASGRASGDNEHKFSVIRMIFSAVFTIILIAHIFLMLIVFLLLEYASGVIMKYIPNIVIYTALVRQLRVLIAAVVGFSALVILYIISSQNRMQLKDVWIGALVAETAWLIISAGFSFYASNMAHYSTLYGSIGAIIILMLWFFLTAVILIMGAELNAVLLEKKEKNNAG